MKTFNRTSQIATLCLLLCAAPASRAADELQDANRLFRQGQHAQALEKVEALLANKPKDAQARFLKGLILTEQGKTNEAIRVFTALTDDYPELPEPYNNLAVLYAGQGQYEKAKVALEMAIRTHPSYATAHENLGDIYAKMASQAYDRALQLDRSNTSTQTKLAMIKDLFGSKTAKAAPSQTTAVAPVSAPASSSKPAAPEPVAAKTAPVADKTAKPAAGNAQAEVRKTVQDWAAAWSAQDSTRYLTYYAPDFKVPDGLSRKDWEAQRRERIAKPTSIKVELQDLKIELNGEQASASFKQLYRASHLKSSTRKVLLLANNGGKWQIVEERTAK